MIDLTGERHPMGDALTPLVAESRLPGLEVRRRKVLPMGTLAEKRYPTSLDLGWSVPARRVSIVSEAAIEALTDFARPAVHAAPDYMAEELHHGR